MLLDVDRTYFDALRAQAVERVAMQTVDARQLVVDQVTALANSGLRSGLDLSFARVNLSQAQVLLVQAQGDVQSAFAALNTAMGAPQTSTYELVDEPLVAPSADGVSVVIAQALRDRPDVAAERLSAQAAAKFADAERALLLPVVSAVATAGVTPYRDSALGEHYSAAGFNVTVPVFNGGLYSARHAEATYRTQVADAALRDLENRVARDVTLAWVQTQDRLPARGSDESARRAGVGRARSGAGAVHDRAQLDRRADAGAAEQDPGRHRFCVGALRLSIQNGRIAV